MPIIKNQITSFLEFLKSADFSKAILLATAIIIPVAIAVSYQRLYIGVAMALGVMLSAPSDVPGSFRRRVIGICTSILIAVAATLIIGFAAKNTAILLPVLLFLVFMFSMLSVFGFRASLISFSGLFALVLGLANISGEVTVFSQAIFILCGGLGYLLLSVIRHYLSEEKQTDELLAKVHFLTSDYLKIRGQLITSEKEERDDLIKELYQLQTDINETHETLRELLISKRIQSGKSGEGRKKLLIFIELLDILELSMANPVNYDQMDRLFKTHQKELEDLKNFSDDLANQLNYLGHRLKKPTKNPKQFEKEKELHAVKNAISGFQENKEARSAYLNMVHFKEKQYQKLISIEKVLYNIKIFKNSNIRSQEAQKFVTHQEYNFKKLQDNFDLKSPIFRHSLRLTVVILLGFSIGKFLDVPNAYWILITSLVILRPGYALTKTRFKQRLYGTLIGGAIATSIILVTQNLVIHGILAAITFVMAFSMIQKNYKTAAAFITLNVVFIYSLLTPNAFEVIRFRLLDTFIGAGLAFLGNAFLWPTWEVKNIKTFLIASVAANKEYLLEIEDFYNKKGSLPTSYKLARKKTFLASGDLSAAFQRITQEPESRRSQIERIYQIVALNQEMFFSLASLGTFIITHPTTPASNYFKTYISLIRSRLSNVENTMQGGTELQLVDTKQQEEAGLYFKNIIDKLYAEEKQKKKITEGTRVELQEIQLVYNQLKWLLETAINLEKAVQKQIARSEEENLKTTKA